MKDMAREETPGKRKPEQEHAVAQKALTSHGWFFDMTQHVERYKPDLFTVTLFYRTPPSD